MKFLIVLSALLVIALADEAAHDTAQEVVEDVAHSDIHGLEAAHKKCQSIPENQIDEAILEKLKNHEKVDLPENWGKHSICVLKATNMLTEDGKVSVEGVKTHVKHVHTKDDAVEKITTKCAVDEETPEKTAGHVLKCLRKHKVIGGDHDHSHAHSHAHGHSSESSESKSDEHKQHHHN